MANFSELIRRVTHAGYSATNTDYCNVSLQTVTGRRPDGAKEQIRAINTGVLTLLESLKQS